jgi:hypothetical protein
MDAQGAASSVEGQAARQRSQDQAGDAPKNSLDPNSTSQNTDTPAVRFSSAIEEIAAGPTPITPADDPMAASPDAVSADQLKQFTKSLQGRPLQERRMNTFQFEPFSLPPSRVCSGQYRSWVDESTNSIDRFLPVKKILLIPRSFPPLVRPLSSSLPMEAHDYRQWLRRRSHPRDQTRQLRRRGIPLGKQTGRG